MSYSPILLLLPTKSDQKYQPKLKEKESEWEGEKTMKKKQA